MPSVSSALYEPTISTTTATTWRAWNQSHVVGTGAAGGGTIIVGNDSPTTVTWTSWNEQYTGAGGGGTASPSVILTNDSGTTTTARIWGSWNEQFGEPQGTGAATVATTQVSITSGTNTWVVWNRAYSASGSAVIQPRMSDEEYQAQLRRQEEESRLRLERLRVEQVERDAANARAAIILEENLTREQRDELAAKQYFTMKSIRPNGEERIYRIHRGRSHNIERVDAAGNRMQRYCMHPIVSCPVEDTMLTQKLWLQNPELEDELLRRANRS
jgi:hypothetical protein